MVDALTRRARAALPRGRSLPEQEFRRRHRVLLALTWLHAALLPLYGDLQGHQLGHGLVDAAPVAVCAALATAFRRRRRPASSLVALGLLSASAAIVHLSHGATEAHFQFFVVVVLLALYEDWLPLVLAAVYVVVHHGLLGIIDPAAVYDHPDAAAHPWRWAAIHAGFVAAAGLGAVATWRLNEDVREERELARSRAVEAERALARHARELERSNRDLEQVAAIASHDLGAPLLTIHGFLTLLLERHGPTLDDEAREFVARAQQSAERMQALIGDLLSWARAGGAERADDVVDLATVADAVVDDLAASIGRRGAIVRVGPLPVVRGDARQLGQLLQNLLSNALKFGGEPPRVELSAAPRPPGEVVVAVRDHGAGVAPAAREPIFEPFHRRPEDLAREGTGMGLAIAQRIAERHGGRLWVDDAPGGGAVFRFTLPAASLVDQVTEPPARAAER